MSERKTRKQLDKIKKKYGVDQLWSFSKYNSFKTDPYGWMLKYIKHEKETKTSIWGVSGGNIHDCIQDFYDGKIKYEQMLTQYEDKLLEMNLANLKYNRKDSEANEKLADKYENNIRLFFQQHIPIKYQTITEQFITIKVGKYVFQGYIDIIYKDSNDIYHIIDWKSSTLYVGQKVDKEKAQLVLYAESLIQRGIPIDKIKIGWNFLKYCCINYQLKGIDKKTGTYLKRQTKELRDRWVTKIENNLRMWLKEDNYEELEIEHMVQTAIENNNLNNIPKHISEKYSTKDCYVDIPLNQEVIDELKNDIIMTLDDINERKNKYNEYMLIAEESNNKKEKEKYIDLAEHLFWTNIDNTNQFFFANLSGYSAKQHKPYKEYLEEINLFVDNKYKNDEGEIELTADDDWLKDL